MPAYLLHRLRLAGTEVNLFEPPAQEALFQATGGLPRGSTLNLVSGSRSWRNFMRSWSPGWIEILTEKERGREAAPPPERRERERSKKVKAVHDEGGGPRTAHGLVAFGSKYPPSRRLGNDSELRIS
jgi:hypothetical protein